MLRPLIRRSSLIRFMLGPALPFRRICRSISREFSAYFAAISTLIQIYSKERQTDHLSMPRHAAINACARATDCLHHVEEALLPSTRKDR